MKKSKIILKKRSCIAALLIIATLLFSYTASAESVSSAEKLYYPGGMTFGVKISTPGVTIINTSDIKCSGEQRCPALEAGLKSGDVITEVNGNEIAGVADITAALQKSNGEPLRIRYTRRSSSFTTTLIPLIPDGESDYKAGMWIRDSMAGIGTVTFIDTQTGNFGGLGHGICDLESEELLPFKSGTVSSVVISGVIKGKVGTPGELRGYFSPEKTGIITGNSECGVFGKFDTIPSIIPEDALPIGKAKDVHEGAAYIWCTLENDIIRKYNVSISDISKDSSQNTKCFTVKVTDPNLIEKSGGIVQGMSGSPIIQDGKLIGAVTHVLVNDPTTGYGIFIENMLNAAG